MTLKQYLPNWYDGILDFDELMRIEDELMKELSSKILQVKNNQWNQTADEFTISIHESVFHIIANPQVEDLDFRRQRLFNRMQATPPFTLNYLRSQLDKIFGVGNYSLFLDKDSYQLFLETSASNANYFYESKRIVEKVKPANVIFLQLPVYIESMKLIESATIRDVTYFRIGVSRIGDALYSESSERSVIIQ